MTNQQYFLLVGLGNPGREFDGTRHNLGKRVVEAYLLPEVVERFIPETFMNDSGPAVADYLAKYHRTPSHVLIVHDDMELPCGQVVLQFGGSAKGHNGVRSIHRALQTQTIWRLRLGIGRPPAGVPADQFVLQHFTSEEAPLVGTMIDQAKKCLDEYFTTPHPSPK